MAAAWLATRLEDAIACAVPWCSARDMDTEAALRAALHALADSGRETARSRWFALLARWLDRCGSTTADPERLVDALVLSLQALESSPAGELAPSAAATARSFAAELGEDQEEAVRQLRAALSSPPSVAQAVAAHAASVPGVGAAFAPTTARAAESHDDGPATTRSPTAVSIDEANEDRKAKTAKEDQPIWLAPDERDLLCGALLDDLLPKLLELARPDAGADALAESAFLFESIGNALEVVGLEQNAQLLRAALPRGEAEVDAVRFSALTSWLVDFTDWLQTPEASARLVAHAQATNTLAELLNQPQLAALSMQEAKRLRIGADPNAAPREPRRIEPGDLSLQPAEDVIPSVLEGMLRELPAHAEGLSSAVAAYVHDEDPEQLAHARRFAHTLKGDSNTVGIRGLANLTHAIEDILDALQKEPNARTPALCDLLQEATDTAAQMADFVLGRGPAPEAAEEVLARVYACADAIERGQWTPTAPEAEPTPAAAPAAGPATARAQSAPAAATEETISVPRVLLDRLLQLAAESAALNNQIRDAIERDRAYQSALAEELQRMQTVAQQLDEQTALRGLAIADRRRRSIAIDPLELDEYNDLYVVSRRTHETVADARERLRELEAATARTAALLGRKLRNDELIAGLVRQSRLIPIRTYRARFERAVRQTARMLDKPVALSITGDSISVDKMTLDALIEPIMHLLRNAIDHGIEGQDQRRAAGKPASGHVTLGFSEQGGQLEVSVQDDGAGIDLDRVRARALSLNLIPAELSDPREILELLFRPGFSSRDHVTQISGRGIGLDVVAKRVRELGGQVRIDNEPGSGTRFVLRVPLAVGAVQVALVPVQGRSYALLTNAIEGFEPIEAASVRSGEAGTEVRLGENWQPAAEIESLFGLAVRRQPGPAVAAVLVGGGVVLCDRVDTLSLVVVDRLADELPPIPAFRGAAVLADGAAAPVIDLAELWRLRGKFDRPLEELPLAQPPARVVVADDSLTIRRSLEELLTDAGYRVETARDGLEALAACSRETPAALLVDLEMPRMNGIDLAAHLRKDSRYAMMPIIMITSRSGTRHRDLAESAGVDALLGKPYSDQEVLDLLERHLHS